MWALVRLMRASVLLTVVLAGLLGTLLATGLAVSFFAPGLLAALPTTGANAACPPASVTAAAQLEFPSIQDAAAKSSANSTSIPERVDTKADQEASSVLNAPDLLHALGQVREGDPHAPAAFWKAVAGVLGGTEAAAHLASQGADKKKVRGTHMPIMNKMPFTAVSKENDKWGDKRKGIFLKIADYISEAMIPGDYVETGVFNGASALIVAERLLRNKQVPPRKLWLYDSWKGMPETQEEDGNQAAKTVGWGKWATVEHVAEKLVKAGLDLPTSVVFREGWFNTTFMLPKADQVAFLHVDSDWYDSVLTSLEAFYDLIPNGGVILFDDFGMWEGCRQAVYTFCERRGIAPLLERNARAQAYWVKGKEHNRDSYFMP